MPNTYRIASTVEEATSALSFDRALEGGDPRWQTLDEARGDRVTQRLLTLLSRKKESGYHHIVFASHRGSGKTTELKRLMRDLEARYLCVYLEANVEMDPFQAEMEDLLLVLARVIEETMRHEGLPLPGELLDRITRWFAEEVDSKTRGITSGAEISAGLEVEAGLPWFAKVLARLTGLMKVENEYRTEIKSTLRKYPGTLLASVNSLLDASAKRLRTSNRDLLLVIDNLDRYDPRVVDDLVVKGSDRFRQLQCSFILTPPISLIYRPESTAIESLFRCEVMPSVRLRERDDPPDRFEGKGRDLLIELLAKRIDLDALLPEEKARDRLVVASAGSARDLLELAQEASLETDLAPITLDTVEKVVARRRQRLRDRIDVNGWWPTLIHIAREKRLSDDPNCLLVLFHRLAFQYNGDGWHDVHPLIYEMTEFTRWQTAGSRESADDGA